MKKSLRKFVDYLSNNRFKLFLILIIIAVVILLLPFDQSQKLPIIFIPIILCCYLLFLMKVRGSGRVASIVSDVTNDFSRRENLTLFILLFPLVILIIMTILYLLVWFT